VPANVPVVVTVRFSRSTSVSATSANVNVADGSQDAQHLQNIPARRRVGSARHVENQFVSGFATGASFVPKIVIASVDDAVVVPSDACS
jgi:hypothetical protein